MLLCVCLCRNFAQTKQKPGYKDVYTHISTNGRNTVPELGAGIHMHSCGYKRWLILIRTPTQPINTDTALKERHNVDTETCIILTNSYKLVQNLHDKYTKTVTGADTYSKCKIE